MQQIIVFWQEPYGPEESSKWAMLVMILKVDGFERWGEISICLYACYRGLVSYRVLQVKLDQGQTSPLTGLRYLNHGESKIKRGKWWMTIYVTILFSVCFLMIMKIKWGTVDGNNVRFSTHLTQAATSKFWEYSFVIFSDYWSVMINCSSCNYSSAEHVKELD